MATRRRLLDATRDLLARDGPFDLKLVDITREINASPATFYQYFTDIDDALLCLADDVEESSGALLPLLKDPWRSEDDFSKARVFVDAYMHYWDMNGPVLRVRNLKAEEGESAFRVKRSESQFPLLEALAAMVDDSIKAGRIPSDANSIARGAAMLAMLERLTAYRDGLASRGTGAEALANTLTRILFQTISGLTGE
jgi:AcrR family transcriptional regulator